MRHDDREPPHDVLVLIEELAYLREMVELNSDWIWEVDAQGRYTYSSPKADTLLGYRREEILGKTPFDFMPPDEAERIGRIFGGIAAEKRPFSGLINRNIRADGSIVVLETSGIPLFDAEGGLRGYRGIDRDVSALEARFYQLEAIYALAPVPLYVVSRSLHFVAANQAMGTLLGRPAAEIVGLPVQGPGLAPGLHDPRDFVLLDAGQPVPPRELEFNDRVFHATVNPVRDMAGGIIALTTALTDVTERKRAEEELVRMNEALQARADEDYLTGLLNRRRFDEVLAEEIQRALRLPQQLTVVMADIDFFKPYNDRYGHQAGDDCLRRVASLFSGGLLRPSDSCGRYGGEEFCAVLPGTDAAGGRLIADRIRAAVYDSAIPHAGSPFGRVTMSLGLTTLDTSATGAAPAVLPTGSTLLAAADTALYAAKAAGRNSVQHRSN